MKMQYIFIKPSKRHVIFTELSCIVNIRMNVTDIFITSTARKHAGEVGDSTITCGPASNIRQSKGTILLQPLLKHFCRPMCLLSNAGWRSHIRHNNGIFRKYAEAVMLSLTCYMTGALFLG